MTDKVPKFYVWNMTDVKANLTIWPQYNGLQNTDPFPVTIQPYSYMNFWTAATNLEEQDKGYNVSNSDIEYFIISQVSYGAGADGGIFNAGLKIPMAYASQSQEAAELIREKNYPESNNGINLFLGMHLASTNLDTYLHNCYIDDNIFFMIPDTARGINDYPPNSNGSGNLNNTMFRAKQGVFASTSENFVTNVTGVSEASAYWYLSMPIEDATGTVLASPLVRGRRVKVYAQMTSNGKITGMTPEWYPADNLIEFSNGMQSSLFNSIKL